MLNFFFTRSDLERAQRMAEHAQAYLDGGQGMVETLRMIIDCGTFSALNLRAPNSDDAAALGKIFDILFAVNSETDALPIGDVRKAWCPRALVAEDVKIANAEVQYRELIATACRSLIDVLQRDERVLNFPGDGSLSESAPGA